MDFILSFPLNFILIIPSSEGQSIFVILNVDLFMIYRNFVAISANGLWLGGRCAKSEAEYARQDKQTS
jgi:hypothetical protein